MYYHKYELATSFSTALLLTVTTPLPLASRQLAATMPQWSPLGCGENVGENVGKTEGKHGKNVGKT
jgi:hypothetical protein